MTCEGNALNDNEVRLGKGRAANATFEYDTAKAGRRVGLYDHRCRDAGIKLGTADF